MPDYIIAYHGAKKPESPEEDAKHMAKFQGGVGGLGDAVVNPGTPLENVKDRQLFSVITKLRDRARTGPEFLS